MVIQLLKLSKDTSGYNFDIRIDYKMLMKDSAVMRFGGATPSPYDPDRDENITVKYHLPPPTSSPKYHLGDLIAGTYCSRIFSDCNEKACRLQSPNFPGVYPRNLTCYYAVRQHQVPPGKHALISVRQPKGQLIAIRSTAALYQRSQQQQASQQQNRELKVSREVFCMFLCGAVLILIKRYPMCIQMIMMNFTEPLLCSDHSQWKEKIKTKRF